MTQFVLRIETKFVVSSILLCLGSSCFLILPLLSKKQKRNKLFTPENKDTEVLSFNNVILAAFLTSVYEFGVLNLMTVSMDMKVHEREVAEPAC